MNGPMHGGAEDESSSAPLDSERMVSPAPATGVQQPMFSMNGNSPAQQGMVARAPVAGVPPVAAPGQLSMSHTRGNPAQEIEEAARVMQSPKDDRGLDGRGLGGASNADASEQQLYDPDYLRLKLDEIVVEGRTFDEVEGDVRQACYHEGIILTTGRSKRLDGGGRYDFKKLACHRGVANRQEYYQLSQDVAPGVRRRNSSGSAAMGCPFQITIRHAKTHPHPKLSNLKLAHNHVIDRESMSVKMRLSGKLTVEQQEQVAKIAAQGMKPKAMTTALTALHKDTINHRAVQNTAAAQTGKERPFNATDSYEQIMATTADGGVCEVKMDEQRRLTHIWWQTREQVSLWNRYGHVAMYDDTAVKNRYRMPIGVLVVIDSEYRTRIVGQNITADTTTDTFVWMLERALQSRGGKQPAIFIQDADAAMTGAVKQVFPEAQPRRSLWHLHQNIIKALAKVLGADMKAFMDQFKIIRQQVLLQKFEDKFNGLLTQYPKAKPYMMVVYADRHRWADYVSPLAFSVGSWTTSRVKGHALIKEKCNALSSLVDVARCFEGIIESQADKAKLRDAIQHLPPVRIDTSASTKFKGVLDACTFPIALWPRRFMEQEMAAAILYCQMNGAEMDGSERAQVLQRMFEYIEGKFCDVTFVFKVHEERGQSSYEYFVVFFSDGSHLCQCRTLQTLGLGCRHFWASMLHNPKFRFHVGLLHEHWLTEKARGTPEKDWPLDASTKWIVADRHAGADEATESYEGAAPGSRGDEEWKAFAGNTQTIHTVLLKLKEKGPTVQDRQVAYADVSKSLVQAARILSDSMPPAVARATAKTFLATVTGLAAASAGQGGSATFGGNPNTVRLPPRASNVRKRSAAEMADFRPSSKKTAPSAS